MKKKIIAANFKMNKTSKDIACYFDIFMKKIGELKGESLFADTEIIFIPPFTMLYDVHERIKPYGNFIKLAAQNFYYKKTGAYTGEINIDMIKDCGCVYAMAGHSERRNIFNESDELITDKISAVYNDGCIVPILCIGESLTVRNENSHETFIKNQLNSALSPVKDKNISSLIIAYEPVWAIGTGIAAKPEDGEKMHKFIHNYVRSNYKIDELRVIYGGSVAESNIKDLITKPHIDGALVGGASLDPAVFFNIVKLSAE